MKIAAVDLFCGVGGLTYGLRKSGVPVTAGIDVDEDSKHAYEANNTAEEPGHPVDVDAEFVQFDLSKVDEIDVEKKIGSLFKDANIRILAGCAPCQAFSPYNHGVDSSKHQDYGLLNQFSTVVEELDPSPHIVTMENTYEVRNHDVYDEFVETLAKEDYRLPTGKEEQKKDFRVYCPEYGVPQKRKRWVLLASKLGPIKLNPPEFADPDDYPTVRDAIGELVEPEDPITTEGIEPDDDLHRARNLAPVNVDRISISEPGKTWEQWVEKDREDLLLKCHKKASGESFTHQYGRMKWDEPAPTMTTQFYNYGSGRFGHPEYQDDNHPDNVNRALSLREGARLQTFPRRYEFVEDPEDVSLKQVGRHIGNAVPPALAETIGESILDHIKSQLGEAVLPDIQDAAAIAGD